jgi:hypothetical protein
MKFNFGANAQESETQVYETARTLLTGDRGIRMTARRHRLGPRDMSLPAKRSRPAAIAVQGFSESLTLRQLENS